MSDVIGTERTPTKKDTLTLRILAGIAILAAAAGALVLGARMRAEPDKDEAKETGTLVKLQTLTVEAEELQVRAQGTVVPASQVTLHAQVGGNVLFISSKLKPGGRFRKGEVMVRLDQSDYELQIEQSAAKLAQAEHQLIIEQSRKRVAEREWKVMGEDASATPEGRSVALREPQLKVAEAGVASARSADGQAKLQLARTVIRAPFNCFVQQEHVDVGQLVGPQTAIASVVGLDDFWVQVSVPVDELERIRVPEWNAKEDEGSSAVVWQSIHGRRVERAGSVVGLLGDLDPVGRMARLLVSVKDPFDLSEKRKKKNETGTPLPLLIGSFVHIDIEAGTVQGTVEVPRAALHEGNKLYVFGASGVLDIREIEIAWARPDSVLVSSGVQPGERIVVSRIAKPLPGMKLRAGAEVDAAELNAAETALPAPQPAAPALEPNLKSGKAL